MQKSPTAGYSFEIKPKKSNAAQKSKRYFFIFLLLGTPSGCVVGIRVGQLVK